MTDLATPNLPARNLLETEQFYGRLGFSTVFRDDGWMILARADMRLEFFPYPQLDPLTSWFSCCLRLDDLDSFYETCLSSGIPEAERGQPRLHRPETQDWGGKMGALVDPDGTLLRLIQNDGATR